MSAPSPAPITPTTTTPLPRWLVGAGGALAVLCVLSLALVWSTQQRVSTLEQELVRRQQNSQGEATEARILAKQAQDAARDAAAKTALMESRLAEVALQRSQLEDLIQSLSRSRDENLVADIEANIRSAMQQSAITGSIDPLLVTLKQSDDRLARYNQPRLQGVRRALTRDLDRLKNAGTTDVASLTVKLDEVIRQVNDLPLLAVATSVRRENGRAARPTASASAGALTGGKAGEELSWREAFGSRSGEWFAQLWGDILDEARGLVRVTRIDVPESVLAAPDQQFFVRENLKLRLLNARLALLSRQFDVAQSDLRETQATLERFFDHGSHRVLQALESVRQLGAQTRQVNLPRPDDTLAALSTVMTGR